MRTGRVAEAALEPAGQIVDLLRASLPQEVTGLLRGEFRRVIETQDPGILSFGIADALFSAAGGTNAAIKAMNRAYDVQETRPFWRRYLLARGLTVLAATAIIAAFILFLAGQIFGSAIAAALGLEGTFWTVVDLARWPTALLLLTPRRFATLRTSHWLPEQVNARVHQLAQSKRTGRALGLAGAAAGAALLALSVAQTRPAVG